MSAIESIEKSVAESAAGKGINKFINDNASGTIVGTAKNLRRATGGTVELAGNITGNVIEKVGLGITKRVILKSVQGAELGQDLYRFNTNRVAQLKFAARRESAQNGNDMPLHFRMPTGRILKMNIPFSLLFELGGKPTPAGMELIQKIAEEKKAEEVIKIFSKWFSNNITESTSTVLGTGNIGKEDIELKEYKKGKRYYQELSVASRSTLYYFMDGVERYLENKPVALLTAEEAKLKLDMAGNTEVKKDITKAKNRKKYAEAANKEGKKASEMLYKFPQRAETILPKDLATLLGTIQKLMPPEGVDMSSETLSDLRRLLKGGNFTPLTPAKAPQFTIKMRELIVKLDDIRDNLKHQPGGVNPNLGLSAEEWVVAEAKLNEMEHVLRNTIKQSVARSIIGKVEQKGVEDKLQKLTGVFTTVDEFEKDVAKLVNVDPTKIPETKAALKKVLTVIHFLNQGKGKGGQAFPDNFRQELSNMLSLPANMMDDVVSGMVDEQVVNPVQDQYLELASSPEVADIKIAATNIAIELQNAFDAVNQPTTISPADKQAAFRAATALINQYKKEIKDLMRDLPYLDQDGNTARGNRGTYEQLIRAKVRNFGKNAALATKNTAELGMFEIWSAPGSDVEQAINDANNLADQIEKNIFDLQGFGFLNTNINGTQVEGLSAAEEMLKELQEELNNLDKDADTLNDQYKTELKAVTNLAELQDVLSGLQNEEQHVLLTLETQLLKQIEIALRNVKPGDWANFTDVLEHLAIDNAGINIPENKSIWAAPKLKQEISKQVGNKVKEMLTHMENRLNKPDADGFVLGVTDILNSLSTIPPVLMQRLFHGNPQEIVTTVQDRLFTPGNSNKITGIYRNKLNREAVRLNSALSLQDSIHAINTQHSSLDSATWAGVQIFDATQLDQATEEFYFALIENRKLRVGQPSGGSNKNRDAIIIADPNLGTPFADQMTTFGRLAQELSRLDLGRYNLIRDQFQDLAKGAIEKHMKQNNGIHMQSAAAYEAYHNQLLSDLRTHTQDTMARTVIFSQPAGGADQILVEVQKHEGRQLKKLFQNIIASESKLDLKLTKLRTEVQHLRTSRAEIDQANMDTILVGLLDDLVDGVTAAQLPDDMNGMIVVIEGLEDLNPGVDYRVELLPIVQKLTQRDVNNATAANTQSFTDYNSWLNSLLTSWQAALTRPAGSPLVANPSDLFSPQFSDSVSRQVEEILNNLIIQGNARGDSSFKIMDDIANDLNGTANLNNIMPQILEKLFQLLQTGGYTFNNLKEVTEVYKEMNTHVSTEAAQQQSELQAKYLQILNDELNNNAPISADPVDFMSWFDQSHEQSIQEAMQDSGLFPDATRIDTMFTNEFTKKVIQYLGLNANSIAEINTMMQEIINVNVDFPYNQNIIIQQAQNNFAAKNTNP